jgi:large subunit ribosomal protein L31
MGQNAAVCFRRVPSETEMKPEIHPEYIQCEVVCGCGERFLTRAIVPTIRVEVCSKCHPFYTGKQKLVDSAGRVERFQKRWGKHLEERKARIAATGDAG